MARFNWYPSERRQTISLSKSPDNMSVVRMTFSSNGFLTGVLMLKQTLIAGLGLVYLF